MIGNQFEIAFSKINGALQYYLYSSDTIINQPMLPNFTRPLTDNDRRGWKPHIKLKEWYEASCEVATTTCKKTDANRIVVQTKYAVVEHKADVILSWSVNGGGLVNVDYQLIVKDSLPNTPKVGMTCGINDKFRSIEWYGNGPWENYIDKNAGAQIGIYKLPIEEFIEPYVQPQETGNRTDVRWMYLSGNNTGLLVVADSVLSMSAWPYSAKSINNSTHTNELQNAGFITLNIDHVQMGVGGNSSWSDDAAPLEKYQIPATNYRYAFTMAPVKSSKFDYEIIYQTATSKE